MKGKIIGGTIAGALLLAAGLIQPWEGYEPQPYRDAVGVLTVCYGHTGGVQAKAYTPAECDALLKSDMGAAWSAVERCIHVPMRDYQAAALVSATFNIGPSVVCGSTLQRKANAGDWQGACAQLDRWVYAKGKKLRGLVKRRAAERQLCEGRT
jgi:lysozyme